MFDIGFFELILIGIIGLVVLGPERLPHAIRMTSAWVGKIRRASVAVKDELEREVNAHEMKKRIQEQMEDAGLEDIKKSFDSAKALASSDIVKETVDKQVSTLGLTDPEPKTPKPEVAQPAEPAPKSSCD